MTQARDLTVTALAYLVIAPALCLFALILTPLILLGACLPSSGVRHA